MRPPYTLIDKHKKDKEKIYEKQISEFKQKRERWERMTEKDEIPLPPIGKEKKSAFRDK